jgi:hypothetical protein
MNKNLIRTYEAGVTILGSYLAVNSFLNSSLYHTIASGLGQLLRLFGVMTISSSQVTLVIPAVVTLIVALVIVYDYVMGQPEDIIDIYQINMLMLTPEVLSHSGLNWMNLIKKAQILAPTRNPAYVYFSGTVMLLGYLSLYFISRSREDLEGLRQRGVDELQLDAVFMKQTRLSVLLGLGAVMGASLLYVLSGPLNSVLLPLLGDISFGYMLFGVPGVALLLLSIWLFLKSEEKEF